MMMFLLQDRWETGQFTLKMPCMHMIERQQAKCQDIRLFGGFPTAMAVMRPGHLNYIDIYCSVVQSAGLH